MKGATASRVQRGRFPAPVDHAALTVTKDATPPRVVVLNGTLEGLKWLGVLLMTLDHVNKYLFHEEHVWMFSLGRLAMPIFGLVLAYNLARPGLLARDIFARTSMRLLGVGVLATPVFIGLGGLGWGWWPLNIMFTLLVATLTAWLLDKNGAGNVLAAGVVFTLGGALVEFWWPALVFILATRWYFLSGRSAPLALAAVALLSFWIINRNFWALAAWPLLLLAPRLNLVLPRLRWFFYAYYPLHLAVLLGIRVLQVQHASAGA